MSVYAGPADWWTDGTDAGRTHITTKGIVQSGLVLNLDPGASSSYSGSGTTVTDLSGLNNNGALTNGPTFSTDNGGVFVLDGTNDEILVPNATSLNMTGAHSFSTWHYLTNWNYYPGILSKGYATTGGYSSHIRGDYSIWYELNESNGTRTIYNPTSVVTGLNAWYNVVCVYTGTKVRIYINGVPAGTEEDASITLGTISNGVSIGKLQYAEGFCLTGKVSTVQIYNVALTQAQVLQNFNALRRRFGI